MSMQRGIQSDRRPARRTLSQIFAMPIVLGILSTIGLVSALIGDGAWDAVSWITLAVPIVLLGYFLRGTRQR